MTLPPPDLLERLTHADLIGVVRDLIGEVTRMQAETEKLGGALARVGPSLQRRRMCLSLIRNVAASQQFGKVSLGIILA